METRTIQSAGKPYSFEDRTMKGMMEYVLMMSQLTVEGSVNVDWFYGYVSGYTNFQNEPLALWMFIPCGEDGKPLVKPNVKMYDFSMDEEKLYKDDCIEYQTALARCYFEGFKYNEENGTLYQGDCVIELMTQPNEWGVFAEAYDVELYKVEHLVNLFPITLTQSKHQELYV